MNINLVVNQYGTVEAASNVSDINAQENVVSDGDQSPEQQLQTAPTGAESRPRSRQRKTGSKQGKASKSQASKPINNQVRISRRQMLEPLKIANKLLALSKETRHMPDDTETFMTFAEKMGEQNVQIAQVRKFVDKQIDDEIQRESMKQSLNVLHQTLTKQGLTLKEVIERHTADLYERASDQQRFQEGHDRGVHVKQRLAPHEDAAKSRARFELHRSSQGFDFVRILECSSSMEPLINYQRKLMKRSKRKHQRMLAERAAASSIDVDNEYGLDASLVSQSARKQRKNRLFRDQDESIAHFIEYIKRLIFLNKQTEKMAQGIEVDMMGASDYDWVAEPEMYQSSSGESKYSNEDHEEKDHLAVGEEALQNAVNKYKNADKIIQLNQVKGQEHLSSHLVHYLHEMNRNGHIPKGFGYVHRKHAINEIDGSEIRITDEHAKAMATSLDKAKYVNKLVLRNTGLNDQQGIAIITAMDKTLIRHLDVSYNPQLSKRFYDELVQVLSDPACHIERLEIEGNKVGDRVLHDLVEALILTKNIQYLNVSRNNIEDAGARDLAALIQECPKLRLLFMHYNRILGFGGNEVAEAVGQSKSLQVFDISWNSICSTGLTKKKEEMTEEEKKKQEEEKEANKKKRKPAPKASVQFGEGTKPAAKGFAELFARGFGEAWADAFASNKSLLHVDMSHNHLEQNDVEIIAEGLRDN